MAKTVQPTESSPGAFWLAEIAEAKKAAEKWVERARKVIKRYRDERDALSARRRKFNILWSNVQVLQPALYGRMPKPEVSRRFKDQDPVGRTAALILERCLEYEVEQYPEFEATMKGCVEDRLLPGRGTAWVRYEPQIVTEPQLSDSEDSKIEHLAYECAPTDYVNWEDFLHNPARTWEEVWWVARRVYMTRDEGVERFGAKFKNVPVQGKTKGFDWNEVTPKEAMKAKAAVWEIWDKTDKTVCWVAENYRQELDSKPDPLELEQFFPCPRPLFATTTTGSLVPVPDYCMYQDQAEELDTLTQRIAMLAKALKVVGVFDASQKGLRRMLTEGFDNDLLPVDTWAAFAEKGGLKGTVDFLPVENVIKVLIGLYENRESCKQIIYEVMGISDIIRGSSNASETLGAQELKAQFGSMRLRSSQNAVAMFATDLFRLKAQIICSKYDPKTIVQMSGIASTPDAANAEAAIQMLKSGPLRDFRISIEADTLAQLNESQEKADRIEFLTAAGGFLKEALPVIQAAPAAGRLLGEMLLFGVRGFRVGRTIEAAFEQAMAQMDAAAQAPQGIPPEAQEQMQAQQQELQKGQQEVAKGKEDLLNRSVDLDVREVKHNADKQVFDLEKQFFAKEQKLEQERAGLSAEREGMKLDKKAEDADNVAKQADEKVKMAGEVVKKSDAPVQFAKEMSESLASFGKSLTDAVAQLSAEAQALRKAMMAERVVDRDASGRAARLRVVERAS